MIKIALVDKCPGNTDYGRHMQFLTDSNKYKVELLHLCSTATKKVLKKDVDLSVDFDNYDFVILIGSEATKQYTGLTNVMSYAGHLIEEKFIPMINPAMLTFKPEARKGFEAAVTKAARYISGEFRAPTKGDYVGIETEQEAIRYLNRILKDPSIQVVAMDSETSSLYAREGYVLGVSLSHRIEQGVYIAADVLSERVLELMQKVLDTRTIVMQNAKFDIKWLEYHLELKYPKVVHDTMMLHYLLDETQGTHGLKALALRYTNLGDYAKPLEDFRKSYCSSKGIKQDEFSYAYIPFDIMYPYAAMDTAATLELFNKFFPLVDTNENLKGVYNKIMLPGMRFLNDIEENGVPFSRGRLEAASVLMAEELLVLKESLYNYPEIHAFEKVQGKIFNPNSTLQLRGLLFDVLGLKKTGKKTGTGADSTDAEVLKELSEQHPIPALILNIRQHSKIRNTYLEKIVPALDRDSRLRTGFNLTSTTSGRLSSSGKLNMQQLPRDNKIVKACIKARPGYKIVSQDLGTAEMYYAAVVSGDKKLQSIFVDGGDFHSAIAKMVFNLPCEISEVKKLYPSERQAAKAVSFGIMYGSGAQSVADTVSAFNMEQHINYGVPYKSFTKSDAEDAIETYFNTYSRLKKWLDSSKEHIKTHGFIYSVLGRKRRLPNVFSSDRGIAGGAVRSGVNFLVQSVASDINLMAAIDLHDYVNEKSLDVKIFALVHDSILCEVREDLVDDFIETMKEITQLDRGLSIPGAPISVDAEIGYDYSFLSPEDLESKFPTLACA
jgi:DNA polymerase I-like protein with 3'-5' exonuclease and polymerase domains